LAGALTAVLGLAGVAALPVEACACGAYVSDGDAEIEGEASVIRFDGRTEDIVMQLSVAGESPEAAWILPVPAPAEVRLADSDIFDDLVDLTRPREVVHERWFPEISLGAGGDEDGAGVGAPRSGVQVLERQTLGPFEVASLAATEAGALEAWLSDNGFALPADLAVGLRPYVDAGWRYVAARLTPGGREDALSGTLQPLWVTFPSDEIVYPMRLSALAENSSSLSLFVLADHRVARSDASDDRYRNEVTYADWVDPAEPPEGSPLRDLLDGRRFLTPIEASVVPDGVTEDYRFGYVDDETHVPTIERDELRKVAGIPAGPLLVAVGLAAVVAGAALLLARRRAPKAG